MQAKEVFSSSFCVLSVKIIKVFRPVSTTAADSAIRCRCGIAFRLAPCHRLSHHTPYPPSTFRRCAIPAFSSHLPKVRGDITASRMPCISVFPAAAHFPPSEGVQYSRIFVSPSEGAWRHHSFESALYQRFSCRRAFPTFRRCAVFPCFRLTFRRCVETSQLRECPVSAFFLPPCVSHLPKVRSIPLFSSHLPKVRSFRCSRCSRFEKAACSLS